MNWMNSFANLVSAGTRLIGSAVFNTSVKIDGSVEGDNISVEGGKPGQYGDMIMGRGCSVSVGSMDVQNAFIDGRFKCKLLRVHGELIIGEHATITEGELLYERLTIKPGAQLDGCKLSAMQFSSKSEEV